MRVPGHTDRLAVALVLPAVGLELAFVAAPLAMAAYYSLHRADYFQITEYRGLGNYWAILNSPIVWESIGATAIFSVSALLLTFGLGFALALLLERDTRGNVLLRAVVLVPYVISMLVGSLLLKWMFSRDSGLLTVFLSPLGLGEFSILGEPRSAMAALVSNAMWRDSAFAMILLLAGLKSLSPQLLQAARIDGAGAWYRFRRIILPLLRVPIFITLVRLMIHFVNVLTFSLVLTGGGPNNSTLTLGLYLYRVGFDQLRLGQASALALLVFAFNLALIGILLGLFRERRALP